MEKINKWKLWINYVNFMYKNQSATIFTIKWKCASRRGFVSTRMHVSIKWNNSRKRNNFPSTTIQIHVVCQELDLALYALVVSIFIARAK